MTVGSREDLMTFLRLLVSRSLTEDERAKHVGKYALGRAKVSVYDPTERVVVTNNLIVDILNPVKKQLQFSFTMDGPRQTVPVPADRSSFTVMENAFMITVVNARWLVELE